METEFKNRTGVDFSKHELIVTERDDLVVHYLKHPEYNHMYSVKFINTNGIMVVTGDYGNWMFCREFHPSADGGVSDGYWNEKLKISSTQDGREFNSELTKKEIEEGIASGLEEYGYEGDELETIKEYYEELLCYVDCSQWEYEAFAYSNVPSRLDAESVPNVRTTKVWLKIVFDAFDEICERLK